MDIELSIIVAATPRGVIGRDGDMPWRLPSDLQRFRRITESVGTLIMGRGTYDSILRRNGVPLPRRFSIVLTRGTPFRRDAAESVASVEEACALAAAHGTLACIIGGGQVYRAFLPLVGRMHITTVHADLAGDTTFPDTNGWLGTWHCMQQVREARWSMKDEYPTSYHEYVRG